MEDIVIDWNEVTYVANKLLTKKLTPDAVSQRLVRAIRDKNKGLYLTLKVAQASAFYDKKVN